VIFDFLWKSGAQVSGIDIFKIACMNRLMYKIISKLYSPMKITEFGKYHYFSAFMQVMNEMPDFEKLY